MSRYSLDEGIVLRTKDFGEIDRIVVLFTRKRGKFQALAKGARKVGNRFGGSLDFFAFSEFLFYTARGMPLIVQGKIQKTFRSLVQDPLRWMAGEYLLFLVDHLFPFERKEEGILEEVLFLWEAFVQHPRRVFPFLLRFQCDVARALGVSPELARCVRCRQELSEGPCSLSIPSGGVVCERCGGGKEPFPLSQEALKVLRDLSGVPLEDVVRLEVDGQTFRVLDELLAQYLSYHGEGKVSSFLAFSRWGLPW